MIYLRIFTSLVPLPMASIATLLTDGSGNDGHSFIQAPWGSSGRRTPEDGNGPIAGVFWCLGRSASLQ